MSVNSDGSLIYYVVEEKNSESLNVVSSGQTTKLSHSEFINVEITDYNSSALIYRTAQDICYLSVNGGDGQPFSPGDSILCLTPQNTTASPYVYTLTNKFYVSDEEGGEN